MSGGECCLSPVTSELALSAFVNAVFARQNRHSSAPGGAQLTGAGFSLVFPALGVVAMKQVPAQNQGSALAMFTAFMNLEL